MVSSKVIELLSRVRDSERMHVERWQTNDALVAPLLRLKDNSCHIDESERVLKDAHKYSELVILYEKKGLHNKGWMLSASSLLAGYWYWRASQYMGHLVLMLMSSFFAFLTSEV